jgi:molybdate transport system substrate-binding protein
MPDAVHLLLFLPITSRVQGRTNGRPDSTNRYLRFAPVHRHVTRPRPHSPWYIGQMRLFLRIFLLLGGGLLATAPVRAGETESGPMTASVPKDVQVAVAANFGAPMRRIAAEFERKTHHSVHIVIAATGTLYAQIENGAPFEILLAADESTPRRLEDEGKGIAGSRFTYALGRLALWSMRPGYVDGGGAVLRQGHFAHMAVANPRLAPYGAAAFEVLRGLGLAETLEPKLVLGENVAQAAQFVATGAAELGFVAWSQVTSPGQPSVGSWWLVPDALYSPIRQGALLLRPGASDPAARALHEYLRSADARDIIRSYGYGLEDDAAPAIPRSLPGR